MWSSRNVPAWIRESVRKADNIKKHLSHNKEEVLLNCTYRSIKDANGCTTNDVPMMINKSQSPKSCGTILKNRPGKASPKNTISGFTTFSHFSHRGIMVSIILSEIDTVMNIVCIITKGAEASGFPAHQTWDEGKSTQCRTAHLPRIQSKEYSFPHMTQWPCRNVPWASMILSCGIPAICSNASIFWK